MEIDSSALTGFSNNGSNTESAFTTSSDNKSLHITPFGKRPRQQDDPFFQEGAYEYKSAWLRLQDADAYIPDMVEGDDDKDVRLHLTPAQACHIGRCHGERTFPNAAAFEHHYETNHRYICETCRKPFPGEKWLELHLREVHDPMCKIRRERGEKTYQCFVEGCDRVCSSPKKRQWHLIDKHHYPKRFNFAIVLTGVIPFAERMEKAKKEKSLWESREQGRQKANQNLTQPRHRGQRDSDSGAMDIEPPVTATSIKISKNSNAYPRSSLTVPAGLGTASRAASTPKKNAFMQYRTSKPALAARRNSVEMINDMDMDPAVVHSTPCSTEEKDKIDMEIDQLQQSMAQLMIPRSVANRMRKSNAIPNKGPR
ncbi:hypothetical protein BGZ98_008932 [Dissophora globulifera]|nr:hypothetical protein BGZ98_008932 [Dissophora globulifera]